MLQSMNVIIELLSTTTRSCTLSKLIIKHEHDKINET